MKITALETIRIAEFANLLWLKVHTSEGVVGLGETFFLAETVEAYVHECLAQKLLGRDPLEIDRISKDLVGYLGLPLGQPRRQPLRGRHAHPLARPSCPSSSLPSRTRSGKPRPPPTRTTSARVPWSRRRLSAQLLRLDLSESRRNHPPRPATRPPVSGRSFGSSPAFSRDRRPFVAYTTIINIHRAAKPRASSPMARLNIRCPPRLCRIMMLPLSGGFSAGQALVPCERR